MTKLIRTLPKSELHLHLEGAAEPELIRELYPQMSLAEIQAHYQFDSFPAFLNTFKWVAQRLTRPEHYAAVARDLFHRLAAQEVRYAEVMLSVGVLFWKGQDVAATFNALAAEADKAPLQVRWIFDAIRQFPVDDAYAVVEMAKRFRSRGVVAFGIGGNEELGPASRFREVFAEARRSGLSLTVHGGETTGPASVWEALEGGAMRIGHGIRAIEDPALVRHLADNEIPLEISISSNVRTGAVASLNAHPVRKLFDAGVPVVLNTDDPAIFQTSLEDEYSLAQREFGFTEAELRSIADNGFRFAFDAAAAESARKSDRGDT
jgi:aminodeoxyfutalosine deaminase